MKKYNTLIEKLKTKTPFALGRFNDGEMLGIWQAGQVVARGDQMVNMELRDKLTEARKHNQKDYWVGLPCRTGYLLMLQLSISYLNKMRGHHTPKRKNL